MNAVYAYDPQTDRFTMQWENEIYQFIYDIKTYSVKTAWDENGKLIARSYKGFRNKLGIIGGSAKAQEFSSIITKTCSKHLLAIAT